MNCTLMHKNVPVVDIDIDEITGAIIKINKIHDIRHLPPGINFYKTGIDRKALNDWWTGRSIPASRDGIKDALEKLQIYSTAVLIVKCYGLSLSDQYWFCPKDSELKWKNINFFTNEFSQDMGKLLFGEEPVYLDDFNLVSPDNTSDGWLRKKWLIIDGKRVLMKGGSGVFQQQPFNEIIAGAIMRRLGIKHVLYTLTFDGGRAYSLCKNFITPETELIPAWRVYSSFKKGNSESEYTYLLRCCDELGIPDVQTELNKMLVLDYIIANEDRHYNNFGFIRNAETLEWYGMAPIFDSGTSLWYDTPSVGSAVESKPFRKNHNEQIKLVEDFKWFDLSLLSGLDEEIVGIFDKSERVDIKRREAIAATVMARCNQIAALAQGKKPVIIAAEESMEFNAAELFESEAYKTRNLDIVLAFIVDKHSNRCGMRVYGRSDGVVKDVIPIPNAGKYWNLYINNGKLSSKICNTSDFPIFSNSPNGKLVSYNAGGWVLGKHADGRMKLISPSGAIKSVTQKTALDYHLKFPLANAVVEHGILIGKNGIPFDVLP